MCPSKRNWFDQVVTSSYTYSVKNRLPKNKKYTYPVLGLGTLVLMSLLGLLFWSGSARALTPQVISGLNDSIVPNPGQFTKKTDIYLEIAQSGGASSLDAQENWTKVYFDKDKASSGIVGILHGAYRGCGVDFSASGACISGSNAVDYQFYATRTTRPDPVIAPNFFDDNRCNNPFTTRNSSQMPASGDWYGVALKDYMATGCDGEPIASTAKTGKVVIFVQAVWHNSGSGRTNAFKVGGSHGDGTSAIAGYWSNYEQSVTASPANIATTKGPKFYNGQYAVQDRVGSNPSEQGNYSFGFGPDCYLAKDSPDPRPRYIKWYDVDLDFYNSLSAKPEFELRDISTGQLVELTDDATNQKYTTVSGSALGGKNIFKQMRFQGKGGHIYAWRWRNVVQRDGIIFWMPYDDFPYLNQGCGSFNQDVSLWQGRNASGYTQGALEVTGGDTVDFLIDQQYTGGTGAAPTTVTKQNLTSQGTTIFADALVDPEQGKGISDNGIWDGRASAVWTLPGMGGSSPYTPRRWLLFRYQVKSDAKDGAQYCVTANINPVSSTPGADPNSNRVCFKVNNSLKPYLRTSGGDVHAGDCFETSAGNGKITGPPVNGLNIGSSGSYIVSAGDRITDFGSSNSPNSSALSFGKTGYYGSICRPRLSGAEVDKAVAAGAVEVPFSGLTLNASVINNLPDNKKYVVKMPAGTSVSGTFTRSVTLFSPGDITITGNIGGDTGLPYSRDKLPVVGILSGSNINIAPGVTRIDAFLYAMGSIDTCSGPNITTPGGVAACKPALTLNGFAMAKSFSFKRTTGTAGLVKAEELIFNAAFYLNPPPVFGTAAGTVKYLGERAPLY